MSDPFAPPSDPADRALHIRSLPWVAYTRYTLVFCGLAYGFLGIAFAPLGYAMFALDPEVPPEAAAPLGIVMGIVMFVISAGFGLANLLAAWGLGRGHKWAWIVALILGGIYAPSACLPFGAIILYGLLNDDVRKAFVG